MQINRLFETIYVLLNNKVMTASELALKFEVSTRTIYRDVEALSSAGVPIYMSKGKGGGISLLPEYTLNKTILTENEKKEIISSMSAINNLSFNYESSTKDKLTNFFGSETIDWIEVDFSSWANNKDEECIFNNLKCAILDKKQVKFLYYNSKSEMTSRVVDPLKIYFKGQAWYLYGYCKDKKDFRLFKLRRIKNLCVCDKKFLRETPLQILSDSCSFSTEIKKVKMKLSKEMAFRVYDDFSDIEVLDSGDFIVKFEYPNTSWVYDYILSFGEYCEVLEPNEIKNEIKDKIKKMFNLYL